MKDIGFMSPAEGIPLNFVALQSFAKRTKFDETQNVLRWIVSYCHKFYRLENYVVEYPWVAR